MLLRPGYITPTLLDLLPDLRIVAVHGAGVDQVDVAACTERGVLVTNAPGANADSVAELAIGLILGSVLGIVDALVVALVFGGGLWLSLVVGLTVLAIVLVGTGAGTMLPTLSLAKCGLMAPTVLISGSIRRVA